MSEVWDLDAVAAEELKEPLRITWKGEQWELAHMSAMDWRAVELAKEIEKSDDHDLQVINKAFRLAMGDEQFARFEKMPQPIGVMSALFNRWLAYNRMSEGESEASSDSSGSTAGPSKPASRRTTRGPGSGNSRRAN